MAALAPLSSAAEHGRTLRAAGDWFLHSGITEPNGGVARYHYADRHENAPVSTEITGYAVSALVYLFQQTGDERYLLGAQRSASFLCETWDSAAGAMPFEVPAPGATRYSYLFDNGIMIRGLLALERATGAAPWRELAHEIGRSVLERFPFAGGLYPILELPDFRPLPLEQRWSRSSTCYQLKSILALRELAEQGGPGEFTALFERELARSLREQETFLPGDPDERRVMDRLHAYLYYLEALLFVADRPEVRRTLAGGIRRVEGYLRVIGPCFRRSDVCAQLLRVRLWADAAGAVPLDEPAAAAEAAWVASYQADGALPMEQGGYWFGSSDEGLLPFMNPVSTAFCLQAADLWAKRQAGETLPDRTTLI